MPGKKHTSPIFTVAVMAAVITGAAQAQSLTSPDRPILQYFEASWNTIRYRMPDVFMAGYGATWLPPVWKGQGGTASIGYDLFDRFDLGTAAAPTHYGTENDFRFMVQDFHRANVEVYLDLIMNHNGTKDLNTPGFLSQGGYPGFLLQEPGGDANGDFNAYAGGCPQSTSCCSCYDLFNGRLLGLIDIGQQKNLMYIRHPTTATPPSGVNIPAGTLYNTVKASNARFYPDQALTPVVVTNPGTTRNPGSTMATIYPFNTADPMQGDSVAENATGLLLRSTRWMMEEFGVDGFRLDAAKHIQSWFWDTFWDRAVYQRRRAFDGSLVTAYSFVEVVDNNTFKLDYVRKPGEPGGTGGWPAQGWEFGNRDALDLDEAGALRNIMGANGADSWQNALNASVDLNDDGFQNGSAGVHHVTSHDNGWQVPNGQPTSTQPTTNGTATVEDISAQAYVLMRPGRPNIYYHAFEFGTEPGNFPRRFGREDAIGTYDPYISKLVGIRTGYARGWYFGINNTDSVNSSTADVLVFTRRTPNSVDNLLVAVNDKTSNGFETRNVATAFPNGTRLWELTGNAADPIVDPNNNIADVLVVDSAVGTGRLRDASNPANQYLKVPNMRNANGVFHGRSYVVYGPTPPSGTLSITNVANTIPPDDVSVPVYRRRITPIDVVTGNSFEIVMQTTQTDPLDPDTDDKAVFRIDSGFVDRNGNAAIDYNASAFEAGFENFLTQSSPLFGGGTGTYRQTIDASQLAPGYHYITVWVFKHRTTGWPIFKEFRKVIYIDRSPLPFTLITPTQTGNDDITATNYTARVLVGDPSITRVHIFANQKAGTDLVALANANQGVATADGLEFRRTIFGAVKGNHRIDVVAFNDIGSYTITSYVGINADTAIGAGLGDVNTSYTIDGDDVQPAVGLISGVTQSFNPALDFNADGLNDVSDLPPLVAAILGQP